MVIVDVVVRCRNEMPHTTRMLDAMARQTQVVPRILFMDCGSTDGSRQAAVDRGLRVVDVDPAKYIPGEVLNRGMDLTTSDVVAFVNADCVPLDSTALASLVRPLIEREGHLVATYARQRPRTGADPLVATEYARAFPAGPAPSMRLGVFFSMAASAIRRSAWAALPFDPTLRYSEDVDWTNRVRAVGASIDYVPTAEFEHSHDYDAPSHFKRRRGEGVADARIYRLGPPSFVTDLLRPFGGALVRDVRAGLTSKRSIQVRGAQALGYFRGRRDAAGTGGRP